MGQARLQNQLQINSGKLSYQSPPPGAFNATVLGVNGPTPGVVLCAVDPGTDISFSQLTAMGGFCWICNLDDANWVTVGIFDADVGAAGSFFPLMEVRPGESYPIRLSRNLQKDYAGTGTGATGPTLRIVANAAACRVRVEAFDP